MSNVSTPLPQRAASAPRTATTLWAVGENHPARERNPKSRPLRGTIGYGLYLGSTPLGVVAGAATGVVASRGEPILTRLGVAGALAAVGGVIGLVAGGILGTAVSMTNDAPWGAAFPQGSEANRAFDRVAWMRTAADSLVGYRIDDEMPAGTAVHRVVGTYDDKQRAIDHLTDKQAVDQMLDGQHSGRAVVALPSFGDDKAYAIVDLGPAPNAQLYPTLPERYKGVGHVPYSEATLLPRIQSEREQVREGNELWNVRREAAAVIFDGGPDAEFEGTPNRVVAHRDWHVAERTFFGYAKDD
jgi:hypothetical protein